MTFLDVVISAATGVLTSYTVWWITFKYLTPKIKFSDAISCLESKENASGFRYRFKFENEGRRNIIDAEVIVRVRIRGLRKDMRKNWEVIYLPISSMHYQKLAIVRPVSKPLKGHKPLRPVFEIKGYACEYFEHAIFPPAVQEKARQRSLTLEEILSIGDEANLQVLILAFDEFSGARKFFESPLLTLKDIQHGYYDKHSVYMHRRKT